LASLPLGPLRSVFMLDAVVFDFDGVVVDSEPIHLACFRTVLGGRGIELPTEDYYSRYVGFDDHDCFAAVLRDNDRLVHEAEIAAMTAEKTALVKQAFAESVTALPGALELMRAARQAGVAVAVCSGGLRDEIELAGRAVGALSLVDVLVSAADVARGKPDPEGYRLALKRLSEKLARWIDPARVWVVEDAAAGVAAAKAAGCKVLAVTNSYPRQALTAADRVVDSLAEVDLAQLE
jgi:beta-phosphoglucomutase